MNYEGLAGARGPYGDDSRPTSLPHNISYGAYITHTQPRRRVCVDVDVCGRVCGLAVLQRYTSSRVRLT